MTPITADGMLPSVVPERYVGLWRRRLLVADGVCDADSEVYWLQSGSLYADLRLPAGRPDLRAVAGLEDLDAAARRQLAAQQGFAGALHVAGNLLTWQRWLDYQPPAAQADVGRMSFERGLLVERGVLIPYYEEWEPLAPASDDRIALRLEVEVSPAGNAIARPGVWVAVGDHFMFALGRPSALPPGVSLATRLADPRLSAAAARALLRCEIDFGLRGGPRPWRIERSTLPGREGRSLLTLQGRPETELSDLLIQHNPGGGWRGWRVVERGAAWSGFGDAA